MARWREGVLCASLSLLCGCAAEGSRPDAAPPTGVRADLHDRVEPAADGRVAWATTWRLCWDARPGASGYELQAITGEGAPRPRPHAGTCYAIEVARGVDGESAWRSRRALQLGLASAQLAYRVRGIHADGGATRWTDPVAAGTIRTPRETGRASDAGAGDGR